MRDKQTAEPFKSLGEELRALRTKACESLPETSGAVEIDVKQLASYELGKSRPNEETLLLLISHFGPQDSHAMRLWRLAGYANTDESIGSDVVEDQPALFTDLVEITANQYGLLVDFKQAGAANKAPKSVARLGMSREHAESIIRTLALALAKTAGNSDKRLMAPGNEPGAEASKQI